MAEKHTPTPWKYGHVGTDALWIGPDYNRTPVAHVDHDMEYARDNSRANAAFIVRAANSHDKFVEALRDVVTFAHFYHGKMEDTIGDEALDALGETARAALASLDQESGQ